MRIKLVSLMVVAVMALCITSAVASAWLDDLNNYSAPENWDTHAYVDGYLSMITNPLGTGPWLLAQTYHLFPAVWPGTGFDLTACAASCSYSDATFTKAYRAIDTTSGAGMAYAQMRIGGGYTSVFMGVNGAIAAADYPTDNQNCASIVLYNGGVTKAQIMIFQGGVRTYSAYQGVAWPVNTWYDVQILWDADHINLTFRWRPCTVDNSAAWFTYVHPTLTTPLSINYSAISVRSMRYGGIDDIGYCPGTAGPGGASGSVTLSDYLGDLTLAPVQVEWKLAGSVIAAHTQKLTGTANPKIFTRRGLEPGTYDVIYSAGKHLRKVVSGVVVTTDTTTVMDPVTLTAADLDGDNEVSSTDLSITLKNYNQIGQ